MYYIVILIAGLLLPTLANICLHVLGQSNFDPKLIYGVAFVVLLVIDIFCSRKIILQSKGLQSIPQTVKGLGLFLANFTGILFFFILYKIFTQGLILGPF